MRIFIGLILIFSFIYPNNILGVHKKIVPISLLQVKKIINKDLKVISIAIITNNNEEINALSLKDLFPKEIKTFKLDIDIIYKNELDLKLYSNNKKYDAIYIFPLKKNVYMNIVNYSNLHNILTFANNYEGLVYGSLLYIEFTNKVTIYLNKKTMIMLDITFNNRFLNMVKIYEK